MQVRQKPLSCTAPRSFILVLILPWLKVQLKFKISQGQQPMHLGRNTNLVSIVQLAITTSILLIPQSSDIRT